MVFETCLTPASIYFAFSWLSILVVLATEGSQSLNETSFTTNNLETLEERSNLEERNNLEEMNSLAIVEKRSNLEKAEDRRASLMREILEEDLGDMKIRLIALEKKVDKLHPGSFWQRTKTQFFPQLLVVGVPGNT